VGVDKITFWSTQIQSDRILLRAAEVPREKRTTTRVGLNWSQYDLALSFARWVLICRMLLEFKQPNMLIGGYKASR
jgi:hypothetical protein